jgi:hypothetical protein
VVLVALFIGKRYADQEVLFIVEFANHTASFIPHEGKDKPNGRGLQHSVREVVVLVFEVATSFELFYKLRRLVHFFESLIERLTMNFLNVDLRCRYQLVNQKLQFLDPQYRDFTFFEKPVRVLDLLELFRSDSLDQLKQLFIKNADFLA